MKLLGDVSVVNGTNDGEAAIVHLNSEKNGVAKLNEIDLAYLYHSYKRSSMK